MSTDYRTWNVITLPVAERRALELVVSRWFEGTPLDNDHLLFHLVRAGWQPKIAQAWIYRAQSAQPAALARGNGNLLSPTLAGLVALVADPRTDVDVRARTLAALADVRAVVERLHADFDPGRKQIAHADLRDALGFEGAALDRALGLAGLPASEVIHYGIAPIYWTSYEAFLDQALPRPAPDVAPLTSLPIDSVTEQIEWAGLGPYATSTTLRLSPMTVLVGANGAGKTTALMVLKLLRGLAHAGVTAIDEVAGRLPAGAGELLSAVTMTLARPGATATETVTWQLVVGSMASRPALTETLRRVRPLPVDAAVAELATFTLGTGRWRGEDGRLVEHTMAPGELALTSATSPAAQWELLAVRQSLARWCVSTSVVRRPRSEAATAAEVVLPAGYADDADALDRLRRHARAVTGVKDVQRGDDGELLIQEAHGSWLDARVMGTGTVRAIQILAALLDPRPPPLFALDEIENYLHADLAARLIDVMRSVAHRTRIVLTTHSGRVLGRFDRREVRVVTREERGSAIFALDDHPRLRAIADLTELGDMIDGGYFAGPL